MSGATAAAAAQTLSYIYSVQVGVPNEVPVDPTDDGGQFCDRGSPYRPALFYHDAAQREVAERSRAALEKDRPFKAAIATPLVAATTFYPAEEYHQDYYLKNPLRYKYYRNGCGRDRRLKQLWGGS